MKNKTQRPGDDEGARKGGAVAYDAPIRVVIIDDHALMRKVMGDVLAADRTIKVIGTASSGEEAIELIRLAVPDVIVSDFAMPYMNGIEMVRQLQEASIRRPVILVSIYGQRPLVHQAREAGVQGYVTKQKMVNRLGPAVHHVSEGKTFFDGTAG